MSRKTLLGAATVLVSVLVFLTFPSAAPAQVSYKVLQNLARSYAGLILDAAGNLYGTTQYGGSHQWGSIFELTPNQDGTWKENVLYNFGSLPNIADGAAPSATLLFDAAGNLYGTTYYGGLIQCQGGWGYGCGTVFKLTHNANGTWTESVLYTFPGDASGSGPGKLITDRLGNFYGVAVADGLMGCLPNGWDGWDGCGVVFKLTLAEDGTWSQSVLYSFTGSTDGAAPAGGMTIDAAGNLYGTTWAGGLTGCTGGTTYGCGVVFKLAENSDGTWTETVLHTFGKWIDSRDGSSPDADLIIDAAGDLYGTASMGGSKGCGVVFKLSPTSTRWTESVLHTFGMWPNSRDGCDPAAGLIFDAAGNLYGTTVDGGGGIGCSSCGVVFKLTPTSTGWKETVLHHFGAWAKSRDGAFPEAGLVMDSAGNLYGTTVSGYPISRGDVFEITQ